MPTKRSASPLSAARTDALSRAFEGVLARTDRVGRMQRDPVSVARRFRDPLERELVALLASSLAFGNVKTILAKLDEVLERIGPDVLVASDSQKSLDRALSGWVHRVYQGGDVAALLAGARAVQREFGSLGARFATDLAREGTLKPALAAFTDSIRACATFDRADGRGGAHILADPSAASACKRLLLFLRWMVRPDDGVDLGLWSALVPASILVMPVDTHIHKLSLNLGLTRQKQVNWRTAEEITSRLAQLDPADPVRFDFALCHLGMLQRCPSKRDPARCEGCGVMPVCTHWEDRPPSLSSARARRDR